MITDEENNAERLNQLNEEMYHQMLEQTGVKCDECGSKEFKEYLKPAKIEGKTLLFCRECYKEDMS
jgi:hypothetical protein